ncbi:hypothetical protein BDV12DRAFT_138245 [Aspergillus spectabilis]
MSSPIANDPDRVARIMLSWHSLELVSCTTLQTLWAGYGHICAITAKATTDEAAKHLDKLCGVESGEAGTAYPLILKLISPPKESAGDGEGHLRKMFSYEVEQYFYTDVAYLLGDEVAVAKCLASTREMEYEEGEEELKGLMATIMVDLRTKFPVAGGKRSTLNRTQVHAALEWLAGFHSHSRLLLPTNDLEDFVQPPNREYVKRKVGWTGSKNEVWRNGGYTYLATRQEEYAFLAQDTDSEWSEALCKPSEGSHLSIAEKAATLLAPYGRPIESYIHGDVKSENLFTTTNGDKVAFFDFQYVGLGLGVCDIAKLFTCSVPQNLLVDTSKPLPEKLKMCDGERQLLEHYRTRLFQDDDPDIYPWEMFERHWNTALVDWCRFQASWGFWGNTEWLEARVRSILSDQDWRDWLHNATRNRHYNY